MTKWLAAALLFLAGTQDTQNLGNSYLGEQGSWDSRDDRCQGSIGFWPALHARASSIDLMPTATTTRAVIRVPLPWAEHQ